MENLIVRKLWHSIYGKSYRVTAILVFNLRKIVSCNCNFGIQLTENRIV